MYTIQLVKLWGAELKIAKLLALSWQSLAHKRPYGLKLALFMTWVHSEHFYMLKEVFYCYFLTCMSPNFTVGIYLPEVRHDRGWIGLG